jgi:hypothetical protein
MKKKTGFETSTLQSILDLLAAETAALDLEVEVLQSAQELIPLPTLSQVVWMRKGLLPMSRTAYLLGRLQRALMAMENVASDLRTDLEHGFDPDDVDLVEADYNAIEAAIARLAH